MTKRKKNNWMKKRVEDPYFRRAHRENYRSRAAYKLIEINQKFKLFSRGDNVLDLGCAPGGWSQVAYNIVSPGGRVFGVDLLKVKPIPGIVFIQGDITANDFKTRLLERLGKETGERGISSVISDLSPAITGIREVDSQNSLQLVQAALDFCTDILKPGGSFCTKVFESPGLQEIKTSVLKKFASYKLFSPRASVKGSREKYIIARGFTLSRDGAR